MKNNLLKAVVGVGVFLTMFPVNAETIGSVEVGSNSVSQTVTVGEVDVPVYGAEITWSNPTFDYHYEKTTKSYKWGKEYCTAIYSGSDYRDALNANELYTTNNCQTKVAGESSYEEGKYFTKKIQGDFDIQISDTSINGRIIPSIKWKSESKYNNVLGKFVFSHGDFSCQAIEDETAFNNNKSRLYSDSSCNVKVASSTASYEVGKYYSWFGGVGFRDLLTEQIPEEGRNIDAYNLRLTLENDPNKPAVTPTKGDTIGTVTVSISVKQ